MAEGVFEPVKIDGYYQSAAGYNYSTLYLNEKNFFNKDYVHQLLQSFERHRSVGPTLAVVYVIVIFALKHYMKSREKFSLRVPLILWNLGLAVFSIMGAYRTIPEVFYEAYTKGLEHSMCSRDFMYGVVGYWSYLFVMSKVYELVDTVFVVLRKAPLMFLHYYHHATIMAYALYWYAEPGSTYKWFGVMNFTVHSFMYTYYAVKGTKIRVPKQISIFITTIQIVQMLIGLWISLYVLYKKQYQGKHCEVANANIKHSCIIFISYFLLFINFFVRAYLSKKSKHHKSSENKKHE